jgi:hypothetical protein
VRDVGRRQIIIKANGGYVVDAAPGFYVVAGHNPGVMPISVHRETHGLMERGTT